MVNVSTQKARRTSPKVKEHQKVLPLPDLAEVVAGLKQRGKRIVQCHGVFDLLHVGHLRHLKASKCEGDVLIVTVTPDRFVSKGPGRPVFSEGLRAEALAGVEVVDYVTINNRPTAMELIALLKPDVYAKGSEYEVAEQDVTGNILNEQRAVEAHGGRIHFTHDITFSSSRLLNDHFGTLEPKAKTYIAGLRERYSAGNVIERLRSLQSLSVLVVGDTIVDEYHLCRVIGKSSKAASLNAQLLEEEAHAGGVLAVANHLAGLCGAVHVMTAVGDRGPSEDFVRRRLEPNVTADILVRRGAPTTVKRRFVESSLYQKMFEETFLDDRPLDPALTKVFRTKLRELLPRYDLVLVADFGHGLIANDETMSLLCERVKFLAVNAQTNSANMGYNPITKYARADYVCLDQEELRLAYHDQFGNIEDIARRCSSDLATRLTAITQGIHGSLLFDGKAFVQTPVFSRDVVDTTGAGDAFLAVTAPCAAAGFPVDLIGFIGNAAGALAIRVLGNREPVRPVQLMKYVETLLK